MACGVWCLVYVVRGGVWWLVSGVWCLVSCVLCVWCAVCCDWSLVCGVCCLVCGCCVGAIGTSTCLKIQVFHVLQILGTSWSVLKRLEAYWGVLGCLGVTCHFTAGAFADPTII